MNKIEFTEISEFLTRIPAVSKVIDSGSDDNGHWWIKFDIDINHPYAWHTVQELGYILNYLSVDERLPTSFKPVSPPPYMNGGPEHFLSWVIECHNSEFKPDTCTKWLVDRLPEPVDDLSEWEND